MVLLRVYLGWRYKAKITLTLPTPLLPAPVLGETPFMLGITGVLGIEGTRFRRIYRPRLPRNWAATAACRLHHYHKETNVLHITLLKLSALILLPFMLAGCGLTQKISDGASSAVKSVFYRRENAASGF